MNIYKLKCTDLTNEIKKNQFKKNMKSFLTDIIFLQQLKKKRSVFVIRNVLVFKTNIENSDIARHHFFFLLYKTFLRKSANIFRSPESLRLLIAISYFPSASVVC